MLEQEIRAKRLFGADQTIGLFVSLYLILLAFFIILSASSQRAADQVEAVVDSVNATFSGGRGPAAETDGRDAYRRRAGGDAVLEPIRTALYTLFNLEGAFSTPAGDQLQFRLPETLLFDRAPVRLTSKGQLLLDQIADAGAQSLDGRRLMLSVVVRDPGADPAANGVLATLQAQRLSTRRLGIIAAYIEDRAFEPGDLSVGFGAVPPDMVELSLVLTSRIDAARTFQAPEVP